MKFKSIFLLSLVMLIVTSCSYDIEKYNIYDENYAENNSGDDDDDDDDDDLTEPDITVSSVAELISAIEESDLYIKMTGGVYYVDDKSLMQAFDIPIHDNVIAEATGAPTPSGSTYAVTSLLNFSGSRNTIDLTDVYIYFNTSIFDELGSVRIFQNVITGHQNTITGLTFVCYGTDTEDNPSYPKDSAITMVVHGVGNTLDGVYIQSKGSYPYGYGYMHGKSGTSAAGITPKKQSTFLIAGSDTQVLNSTVRAGAFGHGIVIQGAQNTYIEGCLVQGDMRSTDDILANDPLGIAASTNNFSQYPPHNTKGSECETHSVGSGYYITAGEMIALSEDGVRTYNEGSNYNTTTTTNVTIKNTTVKNMRGGFHLEYGSGEMIIEDCTAQGNQTQGYTVDSGTSIINCKGDAMYSPLITNWYNRSNATVEVALMPDTPEDERFRPWRIAEIAGSNNNITITLDDPTDSAWDSYTPLADGIVLGASYYNDVQGSNSPVASYSTVVNETGLPMLITNGSNNNTITTNGTVDQTGAGSNNTVN